MDLETILFSTPAILLALTFHEFSHAYVANYLGDPTANQMGRLTLNPFKHLDILGTIMLYVAGVGWAKPVPVNPTYFKQPKRDMLWVALAGPASNLLLAFVFGLLWRMLSKNTDSFIGTYLLDMLKFAIYINLILAFFNLIPVPPLDGSKILMGLIPRDYEPLFARFLQYGHFILLGLIILSFAVKLPVFRFLYVLANFFMRLFTGAG